MLICFALSLVIGNDCRELLTCDERFLVSLMRVSSCVFCVWMKVLFASRFKLKGGGLSKKSIHD